MIDEKLFPPLAAGASPRLTSAFPSSQEYELRRRVSKRLIASFSFVAPAQAVDAYIVMSGGGGGGGGTNAGTSNTQGASAGHAAETVIAIVRLLPNARYTFVCGAGGAAGIAYTDGSPGGDSSFIGPNVHLVAKGGAAGKADGTVAASTGTTGDAAFKQASWFAGGVGGAGGNSIAGASPAAVDRVPGGIGGAVDGTRGGGGGGGSTPFAQGGTGGAGNTSGVAPTPPAPNANTGVGGGGAGAAVAGTANGVAGSAGYMVLLYDE